MDFRELAIELDNRARYPIKLDRIERIEGALKHAYESGEVAEKARLVKIINELKQPQK